MKRKIILLTLLFASQPFAQTSDGTVAKLAELKGSVLVGRESGLASGADALRIVPGTRIITTANAHVVIVYDHGCRVTLEENQRYEVEDRGRPCALLALPQAIMVPTAVASAATTIVPAIFGGAAIGALIDQRNNQQVSPS